MTTCDVVSDHQPGRRAVAVRHVPHTLDVFSTHFPRFPVLPGVLILDDVTAVARLALSDGASPDRWELTAARRVRFRRFVQPGDSMEIAVDVLRRDEDSACCRAVVTVGGARTTTVQELVLRRIVAEAAV